MTLGRGIALTSIINNNVLPHQIVLLCSPGVPLLPVDR